MGSQHSTTDKRSVAFLLCFGEGCLSKLKMEKRTSLENQTPISNENDVIIENNESVSISSVSVPSTSKSSHTETNILQTNYTEETNPQELQNIIKHLIGKIEKSLNKNLSSIVFNKDLEIAQLKSKIDLFEKVNCEQQMKFEEEIRNKSTEIENLKETLMIEKEQANKAKENFNLVQIDNKSLIEKTNHLQSSYESLLEKTNDLQTEIKTLIEQKNDLQSENKSLNEQINFFKINKKFLIEKTKKLRSEKESLIEKTNSLQSDNNSLTEMVKCLQQNVSTYQNIRTYQKNIKSETLSEIVKEVNEAYQSLKEAHNNLVIKESSSSSSSSSSLKRKNTGECSPTAKHSKISENGNAVTTPSLRIKDISTLIYTEEFVVPEITDDDIDGFDEEAESKIDDDLYHLKKEIRQIIKYYLNQKSIKLSKKEFNVLAYEFTESVKNNYLESHNSYKDIMVNDESKSKIIYKIKLYIKIQHVVQLTLSSFSNIVAEKFSREFYQKIRDNMVEGTTTDEDKSKTLTKDFLQQISDSIKAQLECE